MLMYSATRSLRKYSHIFTAFAVGAATSRAAIPYTATRTGRSLGSEQWLYSSCGASFLGKWLPVFEPYTHF